MARLVTTVAGKRIEYELRQATTLGRSSRNTIRISEGKVSREHARIVFVGDAYRLEDLGSSNGTYVNGQRISSHVLRNGDVIRIGESEYTFYAAVDDPLVGGRLGDYQILERLGKGGMGSVYRARQISMEREVAIKVMRPELAKRPEFVESFNREARLAGQLQHPAVIAIHDFGEAEGRLFFSMEYVQGETAFERLERQGAFSPTETARVSMAVAEALAHAHQRGIIHQDIKPDNILLASDGRVKLADLGLARVMRFGMDETDKPALGTPQYVAPEVVRRLPADARSDIYSLGATMFHLATAHPPYRGERATTIVEQHLASPVPDPRERNSAIPDQLAEIIMRCMAKDPARRYASAQEVATALAAFIAAHREGAEHARRRPAVPLLPESPEPAAGHATDHLPAALPARKAAIAAIAVAALVMVAVLAWGMTVIFGSGAKAPQAVLLEEAQRALAAGRNAEGLAALRNLRDQYPGTVEAEEAGRMLAKYEEQQQKPVAPLPPENGGKLPAAPVPAEKDTPSEKREEAVAQETDEKANREWVEAEALIAERIKQSQYAEALALLQGFMRKHEGTSVADKARRRLSALEELLANIGNRLFQQAEDCREAGKLMEACRLYRDIIRQAPADPRAAEAARQIESIDKEGRQRFFQVWQELYTGLAAFAGDKVKKDAERLANDYFGLAWGEAGRDLAVLAQAVADLPERLRNNLPPTGREVSVVGVGLARVVAAPQGKIATSSGKAVSWDRVALEDLIEILPPGEAADSERAAAALHCLGRGHLGFALTYAKLIRQPRLRRQVEAAMRGRACVDYLGFEDDAGKERWQVQEGEWAWEKGSFRAEEAAVARVILTDRSFALNNFAASFKVQPQAAGGQAAIILFRSDQERLAVRLSPAAASLEYMAGGQPSRSEVNLPAKDIDLRLEVREGTAQLLAGLEPIAQIEVPGSSDWRVSLCLEAIATAAVFNPITIEEGP